MSNGQFRTHGGARDADFPRSSLLFEGRFGRIFRTLPAAQFSDQNLENLAKAITADPELDPNGKPTATPETEVDNEENQGIDAGYTYLGQFIDHDLTFDPMSSLQKQNDPDALTDFRTPRFDLDVEVQRLVRWHYQWVVLHDFLPTIVGQETVNNILPHLKKKTSIYVDKPDLRFFHWREEPYMPIEFAAAAYRFGHSMVRPIYRLNTNLIGGGPDKDPINGRVFIFTPDDTTEGLNGFREFPSNWAIDWSLFFDMGNNPPKTGIQRVQKAYKIDTSLVNPLGMLPLSVAGDIRPLAERNLKRGLRMGLPSGQDVARYMDIEPIADKDLRVGKATEEDTEKNPLLTTISNAFADNAPLWYYMLAEAQQQFKKDDTPIQLGPVGGRLVAEVFIGFLLGDSHSFLSQAPSWKPETEFVNNGKFAMADLIKQAPKAQ